MSQQVSRNQLVIAIAVTVVVFGGAGFFGGTKYAASKSPRRGGFEQGAGGTRVQFGGQGGGSGRGAMLGNLAVGEIIAKDEATITVKLRDGGSRIVLLSDKTTVMKSEAGTRDDLAVGKQVIVNGQASAEGSMTAETISLPAEGAMLPMFFGGAGGGRGGMGTGQGGKVPQAPQP